NEKLNGQTFTLVQKAGVDGRLFGSVTTMDIATALQAAGFDNLVKTQVRLPDGHLKAVGEYPVQVALHPDVTAEISVVVQGDVA
ncbi:MAG: 50S ribosomal protein L9, partial [Alcaligenes pakistanensis]